MLSEGSVHRVVVCRVLCDTSEGLPSTRHILRSVPRCLSCPDLCAVRDLWPIVPERHHVSGLAASAARRDLDELAKRLSGADRKFRLWLVYCRDFRAGVQLLFAQDEGMTNR